MTEIHRRTRAQRHRDSKLIGTARKGRAQLATGMWVAPRYAGFGALSCSIM